MAVAMRQFQLVPDANSGSFASAVLVGSTVAIGSVYFSTTNNTISTSNPQYNGGSVTGASEITSVQSAFAGGGTVFGSWWLLPNVQTSGTSFSITTTNGQLSTSVGQVIAEITGLGSSPTVDTTTPNPSTAIGTSGVVTSGSTGANTSATSVVLASAAAFGATITPPAGWNAQQFTNGFASLGYQIPTSTGNIFTFANSSVGQPWFGDVVIINASGAAPVVNNLLMSALP